MGRSYCSLCLSPQISSTIAKIASSYGLGSSSDKTTTKSAFGPTCTGVTTQPAGAAYGDYIEIANLQPTIGTTGTITTTSRLCGTVFNAISTATIAGATACTWTTPFKIGVHFDEGESLAATAAATPKLNEGENIASTGIAAGGDGYGYSGFWLAYWMNAWLRHHGFDHSTPLFLWNKDICLLLFLWNTPIFNRNLANRVFAKSSVFIMR